MLTPEQATFAEHYIKNGDAREAAISAGQPLARADQAATLWLCEPEVVQAIQLGISASQFDRQAAQRKVLDHTLALATSDITQAFYLDKSNRLQLRNINDIPYKTRIAIKKIKVTDTPVPWGDEPKREFTVELHSKTDAIAQAVKMLGLAVPERVAVSLAPVEEMPKDELNTLLQGLTKIGQDDGQ